MKAPFCFSGPSLSDSVGTSSSESFPESIDDAPNSVLLQDQQGLHTCTSDEHDAKDDDNDDDSAVSTTDSSSQADVVEQVQDEASSSWVIADDALIELPGLVIDPSALELDPQGVASAGPLSSVNVVVESSWETVRVLSRQPSSEILTPSLLPLPSSSSSALAASTRNDNDQRSVFVVAPPPSLASPAPLPDSSSAPLARSSNPTTTTEPRANHDDVDESRNRPRRLVGGFPPSPPLPAYLTADDPIAVIFEMQASGRAAQLSASEMARRERLARLTPRWQFDENGYLVDTTPRGWWPVPQVTHVVPGPSRPAQNGSTWEPSVPPPLDLGIGSSTPATRSNAVPSTSAAPSSSRQLNRSQPSQLTIALSTHRPPPKRVPFAPVTAPMTRTRRSNGRSRAAEPKNDDAGDDAGDDASSKGKGKAEPKDASSKGKGKAEPDDADANADETSEDTDDDYDEGPPPDLTMSPQLGQDEAQLRVADPTPSTSRVTIEQAVAAGASTLLSRLLSIAKSLSWLFRSSLWRKRRF